MNPAETLLEGMRQEMSPRRCPADSQVGQVIWPLAREGAGESEQRNGCRVWGQNRGMADSDCREMGLSFGVEAIGTKPGVAFRGRSGKALPASSFCQPELRGIAVLRELFCVTNVPMAMRSRDGKRARGGVCWCRRC